MKNHKLFKVTVLLIGIMLTFSMVSCESLGGLFGTSSTTAQTTPAVEQAPPEPWPTNQPSVVGTWRADYGNGYFQQYIFNANGTGRKENHASTENFRWTVSGNTLTINDQWGVGPMGFNIVGNKLTLGAPGSPNNTEYTRR